MVFAICSTNSARRFRGGYCLGMSFLAVVEHCQPRQNPPGKRSRPLHTCAPLGRLEHSLGLRLLSLRQQGISTHQEQPGQELYAQLFHIRRRSNQIVHDMQRSGPARLLPDTAVPSPTYRRGP